MLHLFFLVWSILGVRIALFFKSSFIPISYEFGFSVLGFIYFSLDKFYKDVYAIDGVYWEFKPFGVSFFLVLIRI